MWQFNIRFCYDIVGFGAIALQWPKSWPVATRCFSRHYSSCTQSEKQCVCGGWTGQGQDPPTPACGVRESWLHCRGREVSIEDKNMWSDQDINIRFNIV